MTLRSTSFPTSVASEAKRPVLQWVHWICFTIFLLALAWVGVGNCFSRSGAAGVPEAALLLAATATTFVSLCRRLPVQNVLLAVVVAGVMGIVAQACDIIGLPFGLVNAAAIPGATFVWAWALWVVIVFNARGAARLILWERQGTNIYGYGLLALTTLLAMVFVIGFETFATAALGWQRVHNYLSHLASLTVIGFLIAVLVTPSLINKKPVRSAPEYHPLIVWSLLTLLFALVAAVHRFT